MDPMLLSDKILKFVSLFYVPGSGSFDGPLTGEFSLLPGSKESDLYGMVDAVYVLYTINSLEELTDQKSRAIWADKIIDCQDEEGWFSKKNFRGHRKEHATAYAIGALRLLEMEPGESYIPKIKPLKGILPLLKSKQALIKWIKRMGYENLSSLLSKDVGWNHVWRSSHIGGGVAASVIMTAECSWWKEAQVTPDEWLGYLLDWLDSEANQKTGYWQRALWNLVIKRPTLIDLGGAAHFYWIYNACNREIRFPDKVIHSTIQLQRKDGLYKDYPFCIDLDANNAIVHSYLQLDEQKQKKYKSIVLSSLEKNFNSTLTILNKQSLADIYGNSHGLPGALAGLVECTKISDFKPYPAIEGWNRVFDKACWL